MGHSLNYFELEKGFIWPDNSKLLANIFSLKTKKILAGVLCIIATISFVVAGICVLIGHSSWQQMEIIFPVILSTLLFVTFWDGGSHKLHTQGGIAIIINILIFFVYLNRA